MNRILRSVLWCGLLALSARAQDDPASLLRTLATLQKRQDEKTVLHAWPHLDSPDAAVREAARLAIQAQPFAQWKDRALEEKSTWASLEALRALVEACPREQARELSPHLCEQITTLRLEHMDEEQQLATLALTRLVFDQLGPVSADEQHQMLDLWSGFSAVRSAAVKTGLERLLTFLANAPTR